ncbi:uncharacterized protein LOC144915337 [Branchiostoma floridae x Branchiostoma belcheri]
MAGAVGTSVGRRTRQDLYLEISRDLTDDEVGNIRDYIGGEKVLPAGTIQHATAHQMFNKLERKGMLKQGDLSFLVKLMKSIDRDDYADAAEEIAEQEREDLLSDYAGTSKGRRDNKKPYSRPVTTKPDSMMLAVAVEIPTQSQDEIKMEMPRGFFVNLDDDTKKQLLKTNIKDTRLKQCKDWGKDMIELLGSMEKRVSSSFLEKKTEQVFNIIINEGARIFRADDGSVIFYIRFDNAEGFENFWASHKTGKLSKQFTNLAITDEMRYLIGNNSLCVSTVALEEDYLAWKHYFNGTTPSGIQKNKVTVVKGCTINTDVEGTTTTATGQTRGGSEDPGAEPHCHSSLEQAVGETQERSPAKAASYQTGMYAVASKVSPEDESSSTDHEGQQWKENVNQLLDACGKGNLQSVKDVIESGRLRVSVEDETGTTPLHSAAANGHVHIASYLLHKGTHVDEKNHMDETALHLAAGSGDVGMVKLLLEHDANISATDCLGNTALHFAARNGNAKALHLLRRKENIDAEGNDNLTALHLATWNGHADIVNNLLRYGADPNKKDKWGHTALHIAAREGYPSIAKDLLHFKADVNVQADDDYSALHFAASENHTNVVEILLSSGAAIDDRDKFWDTALHSAANNGHARMMKTLIQNGAKVNAGNRYGRTALYAAAFGGHDDALEYLIDVGANPHTTDAQGDTALHWAAYHGHTEVVKLLLSKDVDSNAKGLYGRTAVHRAAEKGQAETLRVLLEAGGSANVTNDNGETPLHIALLRNPDLTQILLEKGGDPSIKSEDGGTALHLAVWSGRVDALKSVLETHKVDVDETDSSGCTALDLALAKGHFESVKMLLGHLSSTRAKYNSQRPLHSLQIQEHYDVAELPRSRPVKHNLVRSKSI